MGRCGKTTSGLPQNLTDTRRHHCRICREQFSPNNTILPCLCFLPAWARRSSACPYRSRWEPSDPRGPSWSSRTRRTCNWSVFQPRSTLQCVHELGQPRLDIVDLVLPRPADFLQSNHGATETNGPPKWHGMRIHAGFRTFAATAGRVTPPARPARAVCGIDTPLVRSRTGAIPSAAPIRVQLIRALIHVRRRDRVRPRPGAAPRLRPTACEPLPVTWS